MERYSYTRGRQTVSNPSFSSSLLDSIYQSIDRGEDEELVVYRETMRKKQQINLGLKNDEKMGDFQRLQMIEKWMEKESEKIGGRRRSLADFVPKVKDNNPEVLFSNSSWSSSDSSNGCWFSASEVEESVFGNSTNKSFSSSCYGVTKPKNIKTNVSDMDLNINYSKGSTKTCSTGSIQQDKLKHEDGRRGGFEKKMSRALKIYGDLKKSKQPISPGGKLACFLNSLFTSGHAKKAKIEASSDKKMSKSANASTCSSASSFSRSCLSKTPSSSRDGKSSNGAKRSVRFYPVSVIVDEDCQPCGHKNLHDDKKTTFVKDYYKDIKCSNNNQELKNHIVAKNRRVEEAAEDLLRNYQKRVDYEHDVRSNNHVKNQVFIDDDEEDDVASCASSDLFELDNLSAIGMERYREELPVYETTHLDTNRAIAKGMIL
ncbi:hypothetical protein LIER_42422 [Lithospermum erythrorhizon]|uniref:Protein BIG GRAIN 1-like A n=1 Tax=Lithospermum erythrorhizon TaxID=34254 RepID=A0AAV3RRM6_LITER